MTFLRIPEVRKRPEYPLSVLLGLVTLASVLPLFLLGIYGLWLYVAQQRADQLARMARYAHSLASAVDRELKGYLDTAEVLAASRFLHEGDLRGFRALALDAITKAKGQIVLVSPSGQQLVNTHMPADESLPVTGELASLHEVLETGKPIASGLFVGAVSKRLLFVVRVPVEVAGEIRYVLSFAPRPDVMLEVVEQTYLPDGWVAAVLDGKGRIVARSLRNADFYGKASTPFFAQLIEPNGVIENLNLEGRHVVTSYRRSKLSDWRILVWAPKSVFDTPINQIILLVVGLAVLTLLASLAAGYLAGRIIAEPARQLLRGARALGAGEPVRFESTHMREANVVGHALAEAARNIASREKALRDSELHTRFILRELAHRSKNLLAVVQAIARQTGRTSEDIEAFNERLGERLGGLSRSQDLLVQKSWQGVPIGDLVSAQLAPFTDSSEPRVATSGPPLLLNADAAQSLGMALHELATNASKHGALSVPAGRITVEWSWQAPENSEWRLQVRWIETGGPPVKPPTRKGFGHAVIERLTAASLHGTAELDWMPEGLVWTLEVPESRLAEPSYESQDDAPTC